jgi:hypothetical protein
MKNNVTTKRNKLETSNTSVRPLSPARVQTVVNDLLASLAANPNQTPSERSEVTGRIARRRRLTRQQVAGVRASLTRGVYGDPSRLIRAWKRNNRNS